eukprot:6518469-Lingulodinium_polyedra.AAC.1
MDCVKTAGSNSLMLERGFVARRPPAACSRKPFSRWPGAGRSILFADRAHGGAGCRDDQFHGL